MVKKRITDTCYLYEHLSVIQEMKDMERKKK